MGVLSAALADTPERNSVKWPTAILVNAGLGSLVGYLIDRNTQGPELLYRSK